MSRMNDSHRITFAAGSSKGPADISADLATRAAMAARLAIAAMRLTEPRHHLVMEMTLTVQIDSNTPPPESHD